ncbi:class II aldolase [Bacteroidales bacterium]|nr:class II aldolase [Bacteroidales bacterium]
MTKEKELEEFINNAHRYGREGFVPCSSGNLSARAGENIIISGTGSWLSSLRKEQVSVCKLETGAFVNGIKPSMENGFHLGVFRNRPDVNVVLHFQSHYATAVSCMKNVGELDFNVTAEIPCHVGKEIPLIPYLRPGSKELANAVSETLKTHNACLLINHGQVVCGKSYDEVFEKASFFEMACRIIVQSGMNYNTLSDQQIEDLEVYVLGKKI